MSDFLEHCRFVLNHVAKSLGIPWRVFYLENPVMLKEALEFLKEQSNDASKPTRLDSVSLRNATMYKIGHTTQRIENDPAARRHKVANLDSLATLINGPSAGNDAAGNPLRSRASVWHYGNEVIAILDDGDDSFRDDRAEWKLNASKKFESLTSSAATWRDQKSFVEFLVEYLRDEVDAAMPGLLANLRKLRFTNNSEGTGDVQHGRASMGKSVEMAVSGAEPLPETVILRVKRWADLDHVIEVECLLRLDPVGGKLALKPLADELQEAENKAHDWLHGQLTDAVECPVYYGSP